MNTIEIYRTLMDIGLKPNLLGYSYIAYSMELAFQNPDNLRYVTKGLYVDIATKFNSTPWRVERAMRHAISNLWLNGNQQLLLHIFKNDKKPTNSLFLSSLYYYLLYEGKYEKQKLGAS